MPGGKGLISGAHPLDGSGLLYVPSSGGPSTRLISAPDDNVYPAVSPDGSKVIYARFVDNVNIWRGELSEGEPAKPQMLIRSSRKQSDPQFSPDGSRVAFSSDRSGSSEIWVCCDADGGNPGILTSFRAAAAGSPRWSPDGGRIAFDARPSGAAEIFLIGAQGGTVQNLTNDPSDDILPAWSRDGEWIYFASNRTGRFEIWRSHPDGSSLAQVTKSGGFEAFEAPDGKRLFYTKAPETSGIWALFLESGAEQPIQALAEAGFYRYWAIARNGVYFVAGSLPTEQLRSPAIRFWDFESDSVREVFAIPGRLAGGPGGLTVSPDQKALLFVQYDRLESDLVVSNLNK
jgi:Tol biopolymer transport system component